MPGSALHLFWRKNSGQEAPPRPSAGDTVAEAEGSGVGLGPREAPLQDGDLDLVTPGKDAEEKRQTRENDSSGPRWRRPPSPASLQRLEEDDRRHSHTRPTRKRSGPGGRAAGAAKGARAPRGRGPPVCVCARVSVRVRSSSHNVVPLQTTHTVWSSPNGCARNEVKNRKPRERK